MKRFAHIIAINDDRGVYGDNALTQDIVYTDPRDFIRALFGDNKFLDYPNIPSEKHARTVYSIEAVLKMFCNKVFETTVEESTSLWHDPAMGIFYLLGYTYDGDDYYGTATAYLEIVDIIPPPDRSI